VLATFREHRVFFRSFTLCSARVSALVIVMSDSLCEKFRKAFERGQTVGERLTGAPVRKETANERDGFEGCASAHESSEDNMSGEGQWAEFSNDRKRLKRTATKKHGTTAGQMAAERNNNYPTRDKSTVGSTAVATPLTTTEIMARCANDHEARLPDNWKCVICRTSCPSRFPPHREEFGLQEHQSKSKAIPVAGRGGLWGPEVLRIPHCLDNRLTDGGKFVRPTRGQRPLGL
jgi:hypothetical protein